MARKRKAGRSLAGWTEDRIAEFERTAAAAARVDGVLADAAEVDRILRALSPGGTFTEREGARELLARLDAAGNPDPDFRARVAALLDTPPAAADRAARHRVEAWPAVGRVTAAAASEAAILHKLAELGFDPLALPATPRGKASPAKKAVRDELPRMSRAKFDKAWQRLRSDGRIRERG